MRKGERAFGLRWHRVSKREELVYTRQFSYEWQAKDLQDTENERARKSDKQKELQTRTLQYKAQILYEWQIKELRARSLRGESWVWMDNFR
jgi:type IV secretory pathway VirB9-like protein